MTKIKKVLVEISSKKFMAVVVSMLFVLNVASPAFSYVEEDLLGPATNDDYSQKGTNTKVSDDTVNAALKQKKFTVEKLRDMLADKKELTAPLHQPQFIGFCKQNGWIVEEGNNRYLTKDGIEALVKNPQTRDEIYNSLDLEKTGIESSKGSQGTVTQLYKGEKEGTITLSVELPTSNNNSTTVKMTVVDNDNIFSKYGSKEISLSDIQVLINETLTNDDFEIKNDGYNLKADSVSKVTVSLPTQAIAEKGNKAEIPDTSKILENFGKGAAGYTYHSFPEYNSTKDAYTFISTGKNGYKFEISVPVIDGNKEEAKSKADKVGNLLLWANNAEEIQEGLKDANASGVIKQNDNEIATFSYDVAASKAVAVTEQKSQNSWVQDIIARANEAVAKAKEAVAKVREQVQALLAKFNGNSQTTQQVSSKTNNPSWLNEAEEQLSKGVNYSVSIDANNGSSVTLETNTTKDNVDTLDVSGLHKADGIKRENDKYYLSFSIGEKQFLVEVVKQEDKNEIDAYDRKDLGLYVDIPKGTEAKDGVISQYTTIYNPDSYSATHYGSGMIYNGLPVTDVHKENVKVPTGRTPEEKEIYVGTATTEEGRNIYVEVPEEYVGSEMTVSVNIPDTEYVKYYQGEEGKYILPYDNKYVKIEVKQQNNNTQQAVTEQQSQNSWIQDIIARANEATAKAKEVAAKVREKVQELLAKLKGNSQTSVTFSDKNNNVLGVTTGTVNGETAYYAEVEGTVNSKKQTVLVEISKENYEQYTNTGAEIDKATISFDSTEFKVDKNGENLIIPNKNVSNFNVERKTYDIAEFNDVANASITASKNNVVVKKDNGQDKYYVQILSEILPEDKKIFVEISKSDYDRIQKSGSVTVSVNFNTTKLKGINQNGEMLIPKEDGIVKEVVVNATVSDYKKETSVVNGVTITTQKWTDEQGQFHEKTEASSTKNNIESYSTTETITKDGQVIKATRTDRTLDYNTKKGNQTTTTVDNEKGETTVTTSDIKIEKTSSTNKGVTTTKRTLTYTNREQTVYDNENNELSKKKLGTKVYTKTTVADANTGITKITMETTEGNKKTVSEETRQDGKVKRTTKVYQNGKLTKTTTRKESKITHPDTTKDAEGNVTHYDTATGKAIYTEMKNGDIQCCDVKGEYIGTLPAATLKDLTSSEKKAVINKFQKVRSGDKDALSVLTTSQIKNMNINMSQAALIEATALADKYSIWSKISGESFDSCTYEYDKSAKKWKVVGNGEGYKFVTYVNSEKAAEQLSGTIYNAAIKGRANLQNALQPYSVDIYKGKTKVATKDKGKKGMTLLNVNVNTTVRDTTITSAVPTTLTPTKDPDWIVKAKEALAGGVNHSVSIDANNDPSVTGSVTFKEGADGKMYRLVDNNEVNNDPSVTGSVTVIKEGADGKMYTLVDNNEVNNDPSQNNWVQDVIAKVREKVQELLAKFNENSQTTQQVSSETNAQSWIDEAKEQLSKGVNYSVSIDANNGPSLTPTQQESAKQVVEETNVINIPVTNRAGIGGVFVEGNGGLITTKADDGKTWIRAEVPYNLAKAALMDNTIDNGNILITIKGNDFKKEDGGTYYVKEENVEVKVKATIVGNSINVYNTNKDDLVSIDVTGMTNAQKNNLVNAYNEAIMKDTPVEKAIATLTKNANDYRTLNSQGYRWDTNGSLILKDGTTIAASQFNNFTSQQKDSVVKKWKETNNVSDVNAIIKKYQLDNEFSSSFGDVAAGYTYCSFPEYNAKTNSYEFVATGKNGYKIEVSVPVIGMDKGTAKNKANKIGDLLLDAKSAEELQNGLKTVNYTIKKNNKAVSTVNNVKTEKIPVSLYNSAGDLVFYNTSSGNSIGTIKAAELKGLTSAEKNNAISIFSKNGQNSAALKLVKEYVSERQTNYKQNLWKKLFKSVSISSTYDSETKSLVFQDGSGFEVSIYVGSKNAAKTLEKELDKCTSWTAARSKLEKYKITFIKNDKVLGISNKGTTGISLK